MDDAYNSQSRIGFGSESSGQALHPSARLSVAMDLDHVSDNEALGVLQPVCYGTFEKQLTVIQHQKDTEAAVSFQTKGKTYPQAP